MTSRRLLALLVGAVVVGLLVAAPILSGDQITPLDPVALDEGRIDLGPVSDVHDNAHERVVVLEERGVAVAWFDPRWEDARDHLPGHLQWQEGEGLTGFALVDPLDGQPAEWCITSGLFEVEATGAAFNDLGERIDGPAGPGLPRLPLLLEGGRVVVDTVTTLDGPPQDLTLSYRGARGPRCVETAA